ncbi:carbohydrate binding domain-containing protein [Pseudomonas vranovensis]|uniref:carbohydrate binding domain-containing protein n=1 Tax=Pseudomonas vranovensis TaxID=321661 RepID=UPI003D956F74
MAIVQDWTDFNEGDWRDWKRDANGAMLTISYEQESGQRNGFLRFPDGTANLNGNVIHKYFSGLNVGETYRFSARVRRYRKQEQPSATDLHFLQDGSWESSFGKFTIEDERWHRVTADFQALSGDQTIWIAARVGQSGGLGGIFDMDDLRFGQNSDVTDFEASGMNGWELGAKPAEAARIISAPNGNRVLNFPTPTGLGYNGKVLSRSFKVLQGLNYKFSFRTQDAASSSRDRAKISVRMNGSVIIPEFVVDGAGQWHTKEGSFVAPTNQVSIEFFNGTSDGTAGNDFNLDDLRLVEL